MEHKLILQRIYDNGDTTVGTMVHQTPDKIKLIAWTLEDEHRVTKIAKETRIPAGTYKLGIMNIITPLTEKYRADKRCQPWFDKHIEVTNVPNYKGVYIHIGNNDDHTEGCLLLGDQLSHPDAIKDNPLGLSVQAFKRFYIQWYPILKEGHTVWLTILDENKLLS